MGFWSNLFNRDPGGITANANPGTSVGVPDWNPGDPDGVTLVGFEPTETRALPRVLPSPWSGWPAEWSVPNWDFGSRFNELVDIAWACLDLNASVLSTMPVYRTVNGETATPSSWMTNPDPLVYASWHEFAKQLFWDYMLGEAFVLPLAYFSDGWPMRFRVVPPWLVDVQMAGGGRVYRLGGPGGTDVTDEILHIRYKSTTDKPHGAGPLESAGGRMLTAGVLATYIREVVSTGGVPAYTLETEAELTPDDAQDLLEQWVASRAANLGHPPVLDSGASLKTHKAMSPKDMAMIEIAQFTEGRIADLIGVPRSLVGLPSGDSMTYSNVSSWFDHHDRSSLRPKASTVMAALSNWALPRGQAAELNRDEYSRPAFNERAEAWVKLVTAGIVTPEEVRAAERLKGEAPATVLTGGTL
ncbi:MAG TPA: phage portal protein [Acidimicrobiia bacterium]|nr:phage portal protein [Acidimicrobiia bacterium]